MEIGFIFQILVIVVSIVLHELAHGYTAYFLGDPTAKYAGRLTLNPIKHMEVFGSLIVPIVTYLLPGGLIFGWAKPVPYNPHNLRGRFGEIWVALAGPLSNFFVAFCFGLLIRAKFEFLAPASSLIILIMLVNITLALFNLIPLPPLDGFKILGGLLPMRLRYIREYIENHVLLCIIIFIIILPYTLDPLVLFVFRLFSGV